MATDNEALFTIDAGQILAKLHIAGVQAVNNKAKIFNSGIENMSDSATPDNIGKVLFNTQNKTGVYELGVLLPEITFEISKRPDDIKKHAEEQKENANNSQVEGKTEEIDKKKNDELKKIKDEENKNIAKSLEQAKNEAFKILLTYMTTFVGESQAKKIKVGDLTQCLLNENDLEPSKIKKYPEFKLLRMPEKDVEEYNKKMKEELHKKRKYKAFNICFMTGFSVEVETM